MKYLYKVFRQYDHMKFSTIHEQRVNMPTTVKLDLQIKPMQQSHVFDLYYVPTNDMINRIADIYKVADQLNVIFNKLPSIAHNQFITECLIEELYHTNDLEGVQSTREEIAESVKDVHLKSNEKKRFNSMIQSYMKVLEENTAVPLTVKHIREIYDEITADEIAEKDLPDGEVFRKDKVDVLRKSGSQKVFHRGLLPEEKIISEVEKMLRMMHEQEDIPPLIRIAIGHYYFGYIHPFYDGNGRTSRFISSLFLSTTLGEIAALALSRGSNSLRQLYLDAFEQTNSLMNRGEMNYFIDVFLRILLDTLHTMHAELKEKRSLIALAEKKLSLDTRIKGKNQAEIMYILSQNAFFHHTKGLTVQELAKVLKLSEGTVRRIVKELIDCKLIQQRGKRPAFYYIDDAYLEED